MTKFVIMVGGHPVKVDAMHSSIRECGCPECAGRGPASRVYTREELDRIAVEKGGRVGPFTGLYYEPHGGLPVPEKGTGFTFARVATRGTGNGGLIVLIPERGEDGRLTRDGRRAAALLTKGLERQLQALGATKSEARRIRLAFKGLHFARELMDSRAVVDQLIELIRKPPHQAAVQQARADFAHLQLGPAVRAAAALLGLDIQPLTAPRAASVIEAALRLMK